MSSVAVKGAEVMTDYQFRTILKMVLNIVNETHDVDKIRKALIDLIGETKTSSSEKYGED